MLQQPTESNKKTWSQNFEERAHSVKRSRISRACDVCRKKKIKCDINEMSQCSTCKQYGWDCTFNDVTKKRGPPKGYIESLETRLKKMEALLERIQPVKIETVEEEEQQNREPLLNTGFRNNNQINNNDTISNSKVNSANNDNHIISEIPSENGKVVRYLGSSSGYYLVRDLLSNRKPEDTQPQSENAIARRSSIIPPSHLGAIHFNKINVMDDDMIYIRNKTDAENADQLEIDRLDRIQVAPKYILDALIFRFFEISYDSLPLIDKEEFMSSYHGHKKPAPAPILIYAICTHACSLLRKDDPLIEKYGVGHKKLFDTLLDHTNTLVQKEYLTPRLATIQALVLLFSYPNSGSSLYRNWLRAGMSVRMAQDLGLHRAVEKLPVTEEVLEMRKRLWYCVYCVDRWSSSLMGRPLAIADADCDIELPHVNGGTNGRKDYSLFINFIKLSSILGQILRCIYSPKAKAQGYNNLKIYQTVQSIHQMLNDWLMSIPESHRILPGEVQTWMTTKASGAGPLMVCYQVVLILLYRTFLVPEKDQVYPELYKEANTRCTEAAKTIIDVGRRLQQSEVIKFGWNFTGYAIFQASLIHVYNCTSSDPEIANTARQYTHWALEECLRPLGSEVNSGHHMLGLLQTLMSLVGVDKIPEEKPSPMSVHAIVSGWENSFSSSGNQGAQCNPAAWQYLFSSAATPFFEEEKDWQATLSSIFDDSKPLYQ